MRYSVLQTDQKFYVGPVSSSFCQSGQPQLAQLARACTLNDPIYQ